MGGLVSGFMFSHYWVEKKTLSKPKKKQLLQQKEHVPRALKISPSSLLSCSATDPTDRCWRGSEEGVGARLSRVLGTAPLEVAVLAFLLKGRGGPLQGLLALGSVALSGRPRIASGLGQTAQDGQGPGKNPI